MARRGTAIRAFLHGKVRTAQPIARNRAIVPVRTIGNRVATHGNEQHPAPIHAMPRDVAFKDAPFDYPTPLPLHREETTTIDDFPIAVLNQGVVLQEIRLTDGTAADRFHLHWEFEIEEQEDAFDIIVSMNGIPFLQRFEKPYQDLITFYQKMDTQSNLQLIIRTRPGVVPVGPFGQITTRSIIDAYKAKNRG